MRLGVNGWRLRTKTGVARVINNLVRNWTQDFVGGRFERITVYSPVPIDDDLALPDWIQRRVVGPDMRMLLWENLVLPAACDDDVLLGPSYTRPLITRVKTVTMMYDAIPKIFPEYYPAQARYTQTPIHGWSARHSTRVVTTTDQSRDDIVSAYGAKPERIRVVPLAPTEMFHRNYPAERLAEVRLKYAGTDSPFFLYVGKFTARRNIPQLIEAFAEFHRSGEPTHRLVLVGLNGTNIDLEALVRGLGVESGVKHHSYVEDEDLAPLYSAAEAFVLPYSYESGASLTLLEAQAAGTPVITAGTDGLREAAGGAALFIPDVEVATLAAAMRQLVAAPALRTDLINRGAANVLQYSWRRSSSEILDILHEAARA